MILRVYAMWNRSKRILFFLLFIFVPHITISYTFTGIYTNPNTHYTGTSSAGLQSNIFLLPFPAVITLPVLYSPVCISLSSNPIVLTTHLYDGSLRLLLTTVLLVLAVAQSLRQMVLMYGATKQWHLNRYMQRLTADGILYFVV